MLMKNTYESPEARIISIVIDECLMGENPNGEGNIVGGTTTSGLVDD